MTEHKALAREWLERNIGTVSDELVENLAREFSVMWFHGGLSVTCIHGDDCPHCAEERASKN